MQRSAAQRPVKKNHHTQPQVYYRPFTFNNHRTFTFDKSSGRVSQASIRSITTRRSFYRPDIEDRLAECVENDFARHRSDLIAAAEGGAITLPHRERWARFVLIQSLRSTAVRARIAALASEHAGLVAAHQYAGPKPTQAFLDQFTPPNAATLQNAALGGTLDNVAEVSLFASQICQHVWHIGRSDVLPLYTSDNPVLIGRPHGVPLFPDDGMLHLEDRLEVLYPLTNNDILVVQDRDTFSQSHQQTAGIQKLTERQIVEFNAHQVIFADRWVYSAMDDFRVAEAVRAQYPSVCDPARSPFAASMPNLEA